MTYDVRITLDAISDLDDIKYYIGRVLGEIDNAKRQVERISERINSLDEYPNRNPKFIVSGAPKKNFRRMNIDNYVVIYEVREKEKTVIIIRVLYSGRDLKRVFDRNRD
ncbi:MAG: type II toxin-antitoxin system RelE/ParE family toxin [Coprobacillus sp.]|nr:type II toxin-antitoxin system RelE/ParE family toxin [Coprobacillus sp.]